MPEKTMNSSPLPTRLEVAENSDARLDSYIADRLSLSRTRVGALIDAGEVTVNGIRSRKSYRPRLGDVIQVNVPPPEPTSIEAEDIPIDIVFEDDDLLVVDKPAGLVVHPAPGHGGGTLVNALLHRCRDLSGVGGVLRPGIVHRLDRGTSGVMVGAGWSGLVR